ncbi:hypothetical protein BJ912DRAFT_930607 [Pholiota molesta]|nr:hypothetical protein BJ912DRAFT_930607 [Pholiota molesta]
MASESNPTAFSRDLALSYLALAGATCSLYDHLTTLDVENRPKWQIPQALFFVNRYVGLGSQMSKIYSRDSPPQLHGNVWVFIFYVWSHPIEGRPLVFVKDFSGHSTLNERYTCDGFNVINGILTAVTFFTMHGIMAYRISSMYTHDRKIMRILVTAYLIEFIAVITLLTVAMVYGSNLTEDMLLQNSLDFCGREKYPPWVFIIWIPVLLFEFLICTLALSLGIKYYRALGSEMFSNYRNSNRETSLLYILLRDSIIFPLIHDSDQPQQHTIFLFPVALSVIFGSRLILNLRESYYESYNQDFSFHIEDMELSIIYRPFTSPAQDVNR